MLRLSALTGRDLRGQLAAGIRHPHPVFASRRSVDGLAVAQPLVRERHVIGRPRAGVDGQLLAELRVAADDGRFVGDRRGRPRPDAHHRARLGVAVPDDPEIVGVVLQAAPRERVRLVLAGDHRQRLRRDRERAVRAGDDRGRQVERRPVRRSAQVGHHEVAALRRIDERHALLTRGRRSPALVEGLLVRTREAVHSQVEVAVVRRDERELARSGNRPGSATTHAMRPFSSPDAASPECPGAGSSGSMRSSTGAMPAASSVSSPVTPDTNCAFAVPSIPSPATSDGATRGHRAHGEGRADRRAVFARPREEARRPDLGRRAVVRERDREPLRVAGAREREGRGTDRRHRRRECWRRRRRCRRASRSECVSTVCFTPELQGSRSTRGSRHRTDRGRPSRRARAPAESRPTASGPFRYSSPGSSRRSPSTWPAPCANGSTPAEPSALTVSDAVVISADLISSGVACGASGEVERGQTGDVRRRHRRSRRDAPRGVAGRRVAGSRRGSRRRGPRRPASGRRPPPTGPRPENPAICGDGIDDIGQISGHQGRRGAGLGSRPAARRGAPRRCARWGPRGSRRRASRV